MKKSDIIGYLIMFFCIVTLVLAFYLKLILMLISFLIIIFLISVVNYFEKIEDEDIPMGEINKILKENEKRNMEERLE